LYVKHTTAPFLFMIFRLSEQEISFPHPSLAEPDGLLAIGGDLRSERLQLAYQWGIFPWYSEGDPILWYAPHERCVLFPEKVRISKSMRQVLRADKFRLRQNTAFATVIQYCANTPRKGQDGTWITSEMQEAYIQLHAEGKTHSIETWHEHKLVGGLYGLMINQVFCGESMFSLMSNASKFAFIGLCRLPGIKLIDCQLPNDHLLSLGAEMIPRDVYLEYLQS
jgi:leucyl/phenylalanyl-tRNA--protein transferase